MTKRVLILDDNADNRKLLFYALMSGDYEIHQAELGSDVTRLIEDTEFDLALLDIEIPDGDGLELAEQMRDRYPDAVVIMLSANDNTDRLEQARKVGAHAFVVKPFNLPKVLEFIQACSPPADGAPAEMQVL
ncbi:MAG: response regulator [Chloroflexi bacterium]|nr:response regulator [Chloroflexota bacterium]